MTKSIIPMSDADRRLITQQLNLAYWAFAAFLLFIIGIAVALKSLVFGLISMLMMAVFGWSGRRFLRKSIGVVLLNNTKVRLVDVVLKNKTEELKLRRLSNSRNGVETSDTWIYSFFVEEYTVEVGMKVFAQFEIGERITIEFFELPAELKTSSGLLSIAKFE